MEQTVELLKKFNDEVRRIDPRHVPQPRTLPREREEVWLKAASAACGHLRAAKAESDLQSDKASHFLSVAISLMREMLRLGKRNFSILERYRYKEDLDRLVRRLQVHGMDERAMDDAQQLFDIFVGRVPTRKPFIPAGPKGWVEIKKVPGEGPMKPEMDSKSHTFAFVVPDSGFLRLREKLELMFGPYYEDRVQVEYFKKPSGKGMQKIRISAVKPEEEKKLLDIIGG